MGLESPWAESSQSPRTFHALECASLEEDYAYLVCLGQLGFRGEGFVGLGRHGRQRLRHLLIELRKEPARTNNISTTARTFDLNTQRSVLSLQGESLSGLNASVNGRGWERDDRRVDECS